MLRLEDVALAAGTKTLIEGADWHLRPDDHVGLVGRNGTGKTTLLRLLAGEVEARDGRIERRKGVVIGYLPQQAVSGSERSVWEEAKSGMTRIAGLAASLAQAEQAVAAGEDGAVERLDERTEAFRLAGGYAAEETVGTVLHGLGFSSADWKRSCAEFSGGWQMRIALARLLLSDADVLLLDEPTNHLDLKTRTWLSAHLAKLRKTFVVVSHDRYLLEQATNRTVEIRARKLTEFRGHVGAWLAERGLREAHQAASREKALVEAAKLQRFVDRFGAKASKASAAKSKQKALDRLEIAPEVVRDKLPRLRFPEAPGSAVEVFTLDQAEFGWDDKTVVRAREWIIERGQRWVVLGPNGCGKSTLLRGLAGELPLLGGRRKVGRDVRLGVYAQDLAQHLPADRTGLEHVLVTAPAVEPGRARSALGSLGLGGDGALRPIGSLSGGEKARVVLASLSVQPLNVLFLDEPTNHLDAETVSVFADALANFDGAVVVVTHDRWLVEKVATHVAVVQDGAISLHDGVRKEDLEPVSGSVRSGPKQTSKGAAAFEDRKQQRRVRQRLKRLEAELEEASAEIEAIDERLFEVGGDHTKAAKLSEERDAAEARMERLFEEMGELEATLPQ